MKLWCLMFYNFSHNGSYTDQAKACAEQVDGHDPIGNSSVSMKSGIPGEIVATPYKRSYALTGNSPGSSTEVVIQFGLRHYRLVFTSSDGKSKSGKDKQDQEKNTTTNSMSHKFPLAVRRVKAEQLAVLNERCVLLRTFLEGSVKVAHEDRVILISNLRWLVGGKTLFKAGLDARSDYGPDYLSRDADLYGWKPGCCSACSYSDACDHKTNLLQHLPLQRGHIRILEPVLETLPLDEIHEMIRTFIDQCLNAESAEVYVINAPTGSGKTEAVIEQNLSGVCLAVDTHKLKEEIADRRAGKGFETFVWSRPPVLPGHLQEQWDSVRALGTGSTIKFLQSVLAEPEVFGNAGLDKAIRSHLDEQRSIWRQDSILTTHDKAFQVQGSKEINTFIFDEDPLKRLIQVSQMDLDTLRALRQRMVESDRTGFGRIFKVLNVVNSPAGVVKSASWHRPTAQTMVNFAKSYPEAVQLPLGDLFGCEIYVNYEGCLYCLKRHELNAAKKHLILSATADEAVYKLAFGERLKFLQVPQVPLGGELHCHVRYSYSKRTISDDLKAFRRFVRKIHGKHGFEGVITHKFLCQSGPNGLYLKGIKPRIPVFATFGAQQGLDTFAGKNMAIIGTPYPPPAVFMLWAKALNVPGCNQPLDWRQRVVKWQGFEFRAMTPSNSPEMNHLYLWFAYSEVCQAVGRARLATTDATVHVYSCFPLPGATLWTSDDE